MAEKGRKPAMSIWGMVVRYQVSGGTSRGNLVVLAGGVEAVVVTASERSATCTTG